MTSQWKGTFMIFEDSAKYLVHKIYLWTASYWYYKSLLYVIQKSYSTEPNLILVVCLFRCRDQDSFNLIESCVKNVIEFVCQMKFWINFFFLLHHRWSPRRWSRSRCRRSPRRRWALPVVSVDVGPRVSSVATFWFGMARNLSRVLLDICHRIFLEKVFTKAIVS